MRRGRREKKRNIEGEKVGIHLELSDMALTWRIPCTDGIFLKTEIREICLTRSLVTEGFPLGKEGRDAQYGQLLD